MIERVAGRLQENAAKFPNKAAYIYRTKSAWKTCTFRDLNDRSNQFAGGLRRLGIAQGTRVALLIPPGIDFFALVLAMVNLGVVPVLIDPAIGLPNIARCFEESRPEIFIGTHLSRTVRRVLGWAKGHITAEFGIRNLTHAASVSQITPEADIDPTTPAAIIFTSGSTGPAKGVIYSQANFAAQLDTLVNTFNLGTSDRDLPAFPMFALIDSLLGMTAIIPDMSFPPPGRANPVSILDAIDRFNVNNLFASPVLLSRLADHATKHTYRLTSMKRVITAGAAAPVRALEKMRKRLPTQALLYSIYGATEVLTITVINAEEILRETQYKSREGAGICVGRVVENTHLRVISISDEPIPVWNESLEVPAREVGEITVKSPAVTASYVGGDANVLGKIMEDGQPVHRTGDLGYFDLQGRLWFCGRKSERVAAGGDIFFTEQVEGVFNANPHVKRTALVGVRDEPVLWVEPLVPVGGAARRKLVSELMGLGSTHPQASKIRSFLFLRKFPTDIRHNSKIIRSKLAQIARRRLA